MVVAKMKRLVQICEKTLVLDFREKIYLKSIWYLKDLIQNGGDQCWDLSFLCLEIFVCWIYLSCSNLNILDGLRFEV